MNKLFRQIHQLRQDCEIIITVIEYLEQHKDMFCEVKPAPEMAPVLPAEESKQKENGTAQKSRGIRKNAVDKDEIIALSKTEMSVKEIAETVGCSYSTAYNTLKKQECGGDCFNCRYPDCRRP